MNESLVNALLSNKGTLTGDGGDILGSVPLKDRLLSAGIGTLGDVASAWLQNRGTAKGTEQRNMIDLMAEQRLTESANIQQAIDLFDIQRKQDHYKGLTQAQLQFQRAAQDKYASKSGYDMEQYKDLFPARELPDILKGPNNPTFNEEGHRLYVNPNRGKGPTRQDYMNTELWPNQGIRQDKGWKAGLTDLAKKGGLALVGLSILSGLGVPNLAWAPKALKVAGTLGLGGRGGGGGTEEETAQADQSAYTQAGSVENLRPRQVIGDWQTQYGADNAALLFDAYKRSGYSRDDDPENEHYPGLTAFYGVLKNELAQENPSEEALAFTQYNPSGATQERKNFRSIINPQWQLVPNLVSKVNPMFQSWMGSQGSPHVSSTAAQNPMRSDSSDMLNRFWPRRTPYAKRTWNIKW